MKLNLFVFSWNWRILYGNELELHIFSNSKFSNKKKMQNHYLTLKIVK
jgi:hypothetical protein